MKRFQNNQQGFSLMETLIAAAILAMVVAGTISLSNTSLRRSADSLERAVAMNLGREAVEILRSARDSTYIDGVVNNWYEPLPFTSGNSYELMQERVAGEYYYRLTPSRDGAEGEKILLGDSEYTRKIYVEPMDFNYPQVAGLPNASQIDQNELIRKVRVVVEWGPTAREQIETTVIFTDWRFGS